jgi:hypothetical protein
MGNWARDIGKREKEEERKKEKERKGKKERDEHIYVSLLMEFILLARPS